MPISTPALILSGQHVLATEAGSDGEVRWEGGFTAEMLCQIEPIKVLGRKEKKNVREM